MRQPSVAVLICLLLAVGSSTTSGADKDEKKPAKPPALKPADADRDFAVQGEYVGKLPVEDDKVKYGVQIIALGDGKFHAVAYPGGLPGDGYDGTEKVEADGQWVEGLPRFVTEEAKAVVRDGVLEVQTLEGGSLSKMKKVIRQSPTLGRKPPAGAVVLFDGTSPKNFKNGRMTPDGLLMQGVTSQRTFQSFSLHLEFMLSYMPYARGQGRSNSGCYMQGRYEVQILDSFGLEGKHNECGGIYTVKDPDVNMCFPPLSWQSYDVDFTAASYDRDGKKLANARMTVRHNGVLVQRDVEIPNSTRGAPVKEGPQPGPIYIQDHGNPLRFRNIWVVEKKE